MPGPLSPDTPAYDANGIPIPTPLQQKEQAAQNARIDREQAQIKQGFASQPVAGHDRDDEDEHER